jgi:hypothetical protein
MKKIFLSFIILLLAAAIWAAPVSTPITVSPATVLWDPVTTLTDGSNLPAGDTMAYELWLQPCTSAGVATGTATLAATVSAATSPLVLTLEGYYVVGVRAIRQISGGGSVTSGYTWSQVSGTPNPWFLAYYRAPANPKNIRTQ